MKLFESFSQINEFYEHLPEWYVDYDEAWGYEFIEITKPLVFLSLTEEINGETFVISAIKITRDDLTFLVGTHVLKLTEIKSINKATIAKYLRMHMNMDDISLEMHNYDMLNIDEEYDAKAAEYYDDLVCKHDYWYDSIEKFIKKHQNFKNG
jgi:hypothetical protein